MKDKNSYEQQIQHKGNKKKAKTKKTMKKREGKQRERKEDEKKKRLKPREKIFFDSKHSVTPCQSLSL